MTNRERLLKTNEYELLLKIQYYMNSGGYDGCVLEAITGKQISTDECSDYMGSCAEHIQAWLNTQEGKKPNVPT